MVFITLYRIYLHYKPPPATVTGFNMTVKMYHMEETIINIEAPAYFKYGPMYAKVTTEGVVTVTDMVGHYEIGFRRDLTGNKWEPCDCDQFVAAYCTAVNFLTKAAGIEHLELQGGAYAD